MKSVRLLLVAAGLGLVAYLVAITGVDTLLGPIRHLSWRIVVFLVFPYVVVALLHTLAWRLAFLETRVPLGRLFGVRLAGAALNFATVNVGGEPLKAYLLHPAVPLMEASAAQAIDKTSITIGQVLFLAVGIGVALPLFEVPAALMRAMLVLLGIQVAVVIAFVAVQCTGIFAWMLRVAARAGLGTPGAWAQTLVTFDRAVSTFYGKRPGRVVGCILVHLGGWIAGSLEVYLVLRWLGVGRPFVDALVIDAFGTGVKFMAFAIPGSLGVLEGGYMLVFSALSLGSGLGLAFTVIRRLRMLAWSALGFAVLLPSALATRRGRPAPASAP